MTKTVLDFIEDELRVASDGVYIECKCEEDYINIKKLVSGYLKKNFGDIDIDYKGYAFKGKIRPHAAQPYLIYHRANYTFHEDGMVIDGVKVTRMQKPTQITIVWDDDRTKDYEKRKDENWWRK